MPRGAGQAGADRAALAIRLKFVSLRPGFAGASPMDVIDRKILRVWLAPDEDWQEQQK